ncbi:glycosyl transferase family 1 [Micromonospora sp. NPDC049051]|uniref:glycosyltransferase family protein n=1 Tax=Micromonospora sp. NPDC049051 TaxID=3364264 RepID=UPI00371FB179
MSGQPDLPRVLVVGAEPFQATTGSGVTLANLFEGWPRDRLAQVYTAAVEPSTEVCSRFHRVDPRSSPVDHYGRRLLGRGGGLWERDDPAIGAIPVSAGAPSSARLHAELRALADLSPLRVAGRLAGWVRAFRPDVIYSMLGSVRIMRLADRLARCGGAPLVPHFMDDWPATLYASGELLGYGQRSVRRHLDRVMDRCVGGLCISDAMASEYERRYDRSFAAFANCVDESAFVEPVDGSAQPGALRLSYVGGLHLDRWAALRQVGLALGDLPGDLPPPRLTVHAPEADLARYRDRFADCPQVQLGAPLRGAEVTRALAGADVLVHVESFRPELRRYTRFSLSTKIPQYLAAGRPVLAYGPGELASMRHLDAAGAAVGVDVEDRRQLRQALERLCRDGALRGRLARAGHDWARRHHSRGQVARAFAARLTEVSAVAVPGPVSERTAR